MPLLGSRMTQDLLMSRHGRGDVQMTELRGECPRDIVCVLDAISMARGITRTELVNTVLGEWAKQTTHEANHVVRVMRGNPAMSETAGV